MPRKYKPITYSKSDIIQLRELSSDEDNPRLAVRALMVLRCIEGEQIKDIAAELHERPNTVIHWRNRFSSDGINGLTNLPRGSSANKYGDDLKQRVLEKLNMSPPPGSRRWTGTSLSSELGVPPDVIWRILRKEKIRLKDSVSNSSSVSDKQGLEDIYEVPLKLVLRKDCIMNKDNSGNNGDITSKNMDLIVTARVVGKDGTVIEKEIRIDDALPDVTDFDISTLEGFRRDFDQLEKNMLAARDQIAADLTEEYMGEVSKKNQSRKKQ